MDGLWVGERLVRLGGEQIVSLYFAGSAHGVSGPVQSSPASCSGVSVWSHCRVGQQCPWHVLLEQGVSGALNHSRSCCCCCCCERLLSQCGFRSGMSHRSGWGEEEMGHCADVNELVGLGVSLLKVCIVGWERAGWFCIAWAISHRAKHAQVCLHVCSLC